MLLNFILLLFLLIFISVQSSLQHDDKVLHIGGIFPINGKGGWQGGQACEPAVRLALEDVNKNSVLSEYQLKLHWNDSECDPGLSASVLYDLLYNKPQKLMLLAGCSTVCTTVAEAAKMWNLVVLCYGASSPALSDRNRFPTLFRTHPSATVHSPTRITLMKKFGWYRIAILQQTEEVFISTMEDIETRCKQNGIEIITRQSFLSDPTDAVKNLRRQDARIIVGLFYVVAARKVLCEIYKQQMYGKAYVWFFIGWYEDNWFEVNLDKEGVECTKEQMRIAAEGHITTEALMWNQNTNQKTVSGMTSEDFRHRLENVLRTEGYEIDRGRYPEGYQEAPLAYDAVWAVALAFNKTMTILEKQGKSISDFNYNNKEIADHIYSAINSTQFLGISGRVAFSSQGDRIALTQIEQVIDGKYVKLGYYDVQSDNLTWFEKERWIGGKIPQDRTVIRRVLRTLSIPLLICTWIVTTIGILIAISLIMFNVLNHHRRVIAQSYPACNTIMLSGCVLSLSSIYLYGLDGQIISPAVFPNICQIKTWVLSIGFTLGYGAMYSKVWRVHRLHTSQKKNAIRKALQPWKMYSIVMFLLAVDITILFLWQCMDPLKRNIQVFPLENPLNSNDDVKIMPELEHCKSENHNFWLSLTLSYKGLLLLFGLFVSYETRSVKLRQINDSRYVGMSIYNVVVTCLITAPVIIVTASQQDASFAFVSLSVIFCCFLSMALIFVPKVIEVIRDPHDKPESKYNPDAGMSKEDEDKYKRLIDENKQLAQKIKEKEERLKQLKADLASLRGDPDKTELKWNDESQLTEHSFLSQSVNKDTLIVADFITGEGTSDSAFIAGTTTSYSRASASDVEFSESYL
ncbi:gamma-aminobutyric acid type B receptor subunit 1-like isoform X1 [Daktulosphaira vitifoliae]|uniref:gamma-aminobutyric acid type B receptor subunit 1-like isoform X1 n=1 Tax=Daktulosphaira vitifoliae TaxID=58002 RepID=UPI0021AA4AF7|nr:gamma-aminobutyric acid type B receptor subunit 1-like isoform X1 [Daktulosphaira vitifoliae]